MDVMQLRRNLLMQDIGSLTEYTATGNPATFSTNVAKNLTKCCVAFSPIQSGSGDPSPANIRPITGWTGVNVYISGQDTSNPTTYQYTWSSQGTIYYGDVDITTGILTAKWGGKTINDLSWTYQSQYTRFIAYIQEIKIINDVRKLSFLCSTFPVISDGRAIANVPNNAMYSGGLTNIAIKTNEYTTEAGLKGQYGTAQIVYPLETPVVYQLTPQQITSFVGSNVLWSDANGSIEVKYLKRE